MQTKLMMKPLRANGSFLCWVILVAMSCALSCSSPVKTHTKKLLSLIPADTGYLFHFNVDAKSPLAKETARVFKEQKSTLMKMDPKLQPLFNLYGSILEHIERGDMDKLGLSDQFKIGLYGMWLWPVVIQEVNNRDRYIKWLSELSGSDIVPDPSSPNIYRFKDSAGAPFYPILGFSGDHIAQIALAHAETEAIIIPYLNGQKTHQRSLYDEGSVQRLAESVHIVGDTALFWIDIVRIYKMLTQPEGVHVKLRTAEIARDLERSKAHDRHCEREMWGLLTKVQSVIGGNLKGLNMRVFLKLDTDLAAHLSKVTARDVSAVTPQDGLLGVSFAVNVKGVIDVAQAFIQETLDKPYQCRNLKRDLQPQALRQMQTQLAMLPPFATDLQGVSVQIYNAELNLAAPKVDAALIVSAKQAPKLIQIAQAFVPILAELKVPEAGKGVQEISGLPLPMSLQPIYSQLEAHGLGIALGERGKERLKRSLSAPQKGAAPLFRVSYNIDQITKLFKDKIPAQIQQSIGMSTPMSNHITIELGFNKSGLMIESRAEAQKTKK